jgi:hypothetical protein
LQRRWTCVSALRRVLPPLLNICAEIANGAFQVVLKDWKLPNANLWACLRWDEPAG